MFGFRSNYTDQKGAQVPLLIWTDLYCPDLEPGDQVEIVWSLGNGWQVSPDGKFVIPAQGNKRNEKGFTNSSMMGRLIARVAKEMKVPEVLNSGLGPNRSEIWTGLGFHMNRQEQHFEGGADRGISDRKRLMPTSYLGRKDPGEIRRLGAGAPPTPEMGAGAVSAPTSAPAPSSAGPTPNSLLDQIRTLAKANKAAGRTKSQWQADVLGLPNVSADPAILNQILDDGPTGIWTSS